VHLDDVEVHDEGAGDEEEYVVEMDDTNDLQVKIFLKLSREVNNVSRETSFQCEIIFLTFCLSNSIN